MTELPPPTVFAPPDASSPAGGGPAELHGMIAVNQASKFFGSVVAVSDVSFAIDDGVTALLGPNGAGKSTLFRMMCGLTPPSRGSISVLGENPRNDRVVRGRIALVPQQDALFDHLDAREFVTIAAESQGMPSPHEAAEHALEQVELSDTGDKRLGEFSKGMRQRVKVASALVNDPEVLILDEDRTLPPAGRRWPVCARVEPRPGRGRPARFPGTRHRAGSAHRARRLPRPPNADG
jgi:ABC-2 type transport system ATP-binding protein